MIFGSKIIYTGSVLNDESNFTSKVTALSVEDMENAVVRFVKSLALNVVPDRVKLRLFTDAVAACIVISSFTVNPLFCAIILVNVLFCSFFPTFAKTLPNLLTGVLG